jgi:hypothetical protein
MSTNHHTDIAVGAAADAATFNTPLGQLDAAIAALVTGWVPDSATWTYAGATTFTVSGDVTTRFPVGTKLKLTQTSIKYFYVIAASYSAPNTTVTITGGSDYTLASAAITSPNFSYMASPQGFPQWFNCVPILSQGASSNIAKTVNLAYFAMKGREVTFHFNFNITGTGTAGSNIAVSLPITAAAYATNYDAQGLGNYLDQGTASYTCFICGSTGSADQMNSVWFIPTNQANASNKILGTDPAITVANNDACNGHMVYRV